MQRQLEIVTSLQQQADQARAAREREQPASPAAPSPPPSTRTTVELGAVGVFGLGAANPTLAGGTARGLWSRGLLRLGTSLSLSGMRETRQGYDLSFLRSLVAARAGVGIARGVVDFDVTAGPALLVLFEDAHAAGRHTVAALAFTVGPRLGFALGGPIALVVGADLDVAVTDEKVTAGAARVAQFSYGVVEVTVGLAWRSIR
jgi:hypothetical protein